MIFRNMSDFVKFSRKHRNTDPSGGLFRELMIDSATMVVTFPTLTTPESKDSQPLRGQEANLPCASTKKHIMH